MAGSTRRQFVTAALVALAVPARAASALARRAGVGPPDPPHPTPRPGVTAARVATAAMLADAPKLIPLFDAVRAIPQVVDGIRCNCGCATLPDVYSLLSCYEGDAMARHCAICQGQARLAVRLHAAGRSLADIRVAVDAKFG